MAWRPKMDGNYFNHASSAGGGGDSADALVVEVAEMYKEAHYA